MQMYDDRREVNLIGFYGTFTASLVSGFASAYLLVVLQRLPASRRTKLLARQLWHLALADLSFAVFEIVAALLDFASLYGWTGSGFSETRLIWLCRASYVGTMIGQEASAIFECHLALSFAAAILKNRRALDFLGRSLPFMWLLAILLAVLATGTLDTIWTGGHDDDSCACDWIGAEWIWVASALTTTALCLTSYTVCSFRMGNVGAVVQKSVWARAGLYLLMSIVIISPHVLYSLICVIWNESARIQDISYAITETLYDLNGLLNFVVYTLQNRHARRLIRRRRKQDGRLLDAIPASIERGHSYPTTFRSSPSILEVDAYRRSGSMPEDYFEEMFSGVLSEFSNDPPATIQAASQLTSSGVGAI